MSVKIISDKTPEEFESHIAESFSALKVSDVAYHITYGGGINLVNYVAIVTYEE